MEPTILETPEVQVESAALVKIVEASGLEQTKGERLLQMFSPFLNRMSEIERKIHAINKDHPSREDMGMAREIRLALMKEVRKPAEKVKDDGKRNIIIEGRLYDSMYGVINNTSKALEIQCEQIENYFVIQENKRRDQLAEDRIFKLSEYGVNTEFYNLREMTPDAFNELLDASKIAHEQKIKKQQQEEEEMLLAEKRARLYNERFAKLKYLFPFIPDFDAIDFGSISDEEFETIHSNALAAKKTQDDEYERQKTENERLKKEATERERQMAEQQAQAEKERFVAAENALKERRAAEDREKKLKAEQDAKLAEAKRLQDEQRRVVAATEAKLKAEQEARQKIEAEWKAKRDAEEKRLAAEKKQREAEAEAPDFEKLLTLADQLEAFEMPNVTSEPAGAILINVEIRLRNVAKYIRDKSSIKKSNTTP